MALVDHEDTWRHAFGDQDTQYLERHKRLLTAYVNERVRHRNLKVVDLSEDLRDGTILWNLFEVLSKSSFAALGGRLNKGSMKIHHLDNLNFLWRECISKSVPLKGTIGPEDIVNGNLKLTLALIFSTMIFFTTKALDMESSLMALKAKLLEWISIGLPTDRRPTNLTSDLVDGKVLLHLVARLHVLRL